MSGDDHGPGDRKRARIEAEDRGWVELRAMVDPLSAREMATDGYYEDWPVKDLLAHLGCWMAEAATVPERIRQDASGVERPSHRHRPGRRMVPGVR